ncbi:active breakpoint cluster region-related -like, partial [Paramuricea clavata]
MDTDIIGETKQKFSIAWKDHFASRELPSLDFLNDSDQAYQQFRHSIAVINDCFASVKVEVFIVKFLQTYILSEGKCAADLKLGFNVGEIIADLESIFPGKTHVDGSGNETDVTNRSLGETTAKSTHSSEGNEGNSIDKTSTSDSAKPTVKRDLRDKSNAIESQNSVKHDNEQSMSVSEAKPNDKFDKSANKTEDETKLSSPPTKERPSAEMDAQIVNNEKITIFTPIPDEHIENKSDETKNESSSTPDSSPVKVISGKLNDTGLDSSLGKQSCNMVHVESTPQNGTDDLQSSGNELDNADGTFTEETFSSDSCSNSPDPVHGNVFLQDGVHGSDDILNIMPFSARSTSFYSVDPSLESSNFGTAEHIYEDIDKYRTNTDEEYVGETRRHLSQSEVMLKKTFSVGALSKPKDSISDDVFISQGANSPKVDEKQDRNSSPGALSLPENSTNVHKRSSSDAGVSYHIQQHRERRARRRKELGFQIIDQQGVSIADGRSKNIQSVLEQAVDDEHKLHMRKWVVAGLVDSERGYLEALEKLTKPMKPIKASLTTSSPICTVFEFHRIYDKVEELYKIHGHFLSEIEERVSNWNLKQIIGDLFTVLMDQFPIYQHYIRNNKAAMETIEKCKISETFKNIFTQEITLLSTQEIATYESLFRKPLERIARYILAMDDLIKYTPEEHPDYEMLQSFMKRAQEFLEKNYSQQPEVD